MGKPLNAAGCKAIAEACETFSVKVEKWGSGVVYPHKDMAECGISLPTHIHGNGTMVTIPVQIGNPGTPSPTVWFPTPIPTFTPVTGRMFVSVRDPKDDEIASLKEAVAELSKRPTVEAWKALCAEMAELRAKIDHNASIPVANKPPAVPINAIKHSEPKSPWVPKNPWGR